MLFECEVLIAYTIFDLTSKAVANGHIWCSSESSRQPFDIFCARRKRVWGGSANRFTVAS